MKSLSVVVDNVSLVWVYNPLTQRARFYIDGQLQAVVENPLPVTRYRSGAEGQLQFEVEWALEANNARLLLTQGTEVIHDAWQPLVDVSQSELVDQQKAEAKTHPIRNFSPVSVGLIALKLFKSASVFKVALAGASLAAYSLIMSIEFAVALLGILVFHEYGHLRAMKRMGIPTKGMYLIPFVGGIAVGDKPETRWQEVYIAMMGPIFGLLMTLVFFVIYLITDNTFAALVASLSALINLFNLIPVMPLDGGRVVKALVFSGNNRLALIALLTVSALCFVATLHFHLYLITFFIVIGVVDIFVSWRSRHIEDLVPLQRYGIWFSLVWYLVVCAAFVGMILLIAKTGTAGGEIAAKVLAS